MLTTETTEQTIARMSDRHIDREIDALRAHAAGRGEEPGIVDAILDALFAERKRRIEAAQKSIAAAEALWERFFMHSALDVSVEAAERLVHAEVSSATESQFARKAVACPKCRMPHGAPCHGKSGRTIAGGRRVHPERVRRARSVFRDAFGAV